MRCNFINIYAAFTKWKTVSWNMVYSTLSGSLSEKKKIYMSMYIYNLLLPFQNTLCNFVNTIQALTAAVAEWLARRTRWSCWRYGVRKVVSSNPDRGNIVGWVFHPTRWLERFSLIWICLSFQILNLFRTLSSWGSINYKPSALLL